MAPRGAIFLCRPSVTVIALLDHDDAVAMMVAPAAMPATIVVHLGTRAVPAVVMTATTLDDDGLGACHRRHRHRHRAESRQHKSKLLHVVLLTCGENETSDA